ncbi:hypothetical protein MFIFM68171_02521 [Madurella fahalii]|uniref:Uncharacterized protein n=1 Tax=Madurella fahalii TaxID=1157608 RepID=A0ABQ0G3K2_9PEZI
MINIIGLNYQGGYSAYSAFHSKFPSKVIIGSETALYISSRRAYFFPVTSKTIERYSVNGGADNTRKYVSAYKLTKFVWKRFDYLGEPTSYGGNGGARSSYFGIVDLAGFKKDRFYIYQARWRPDLPMAHILPHWTWSARISQVTPVHVFSWGLKVSQPTPLTKQICATARATN